MLTLTHRRPNGRHPYALVDALLADWGMTAAETPRVLRPRFDVTETAAGYEVRAELPGMSRQDVEIDVEGARVAIRAAVPREEVPKEGEKLLYTERTCRSYARTFELPQEVNSAEASATFENGVLTLMLPKREPSKSTRIAIK